MAATAPLVPTPTAIAGVPVIRAGRWIVLLAALLALAVLATELASAASLFTAVAKAIGSAGSAMAIGGVAQRLWSGAAVGSAQLPGGMGVELEGSDEAAGVARELDRFRRVTARRLDRLEREVFGGNGHRR